jgi:hypothetical protein
LAFCLNQITSISEHRRAFVPLLPVVEGRVYGGHHVQQKRPSGNPANVLYFPNSEKTPSRQILPILVLLAVIGPSEKWVPLIQTMLPLLSR